MKHSEIYLYLLQLFIDHVMRLHKVGWYETNNIWSTCVQAEDGVEILPEGGVETMSNQEFKFEEMYRRPVNLEELCGSPG